MVGPTKRLHLTAACAFRSGSDGTSNIIFALHLPLPAAVGEAQRSAKA